MNRRNMLGIATAVGFMLAATANAAPPVTTGLKLHLDASQLTGLSDGATVNTWTDMSGLNNHATRTAGAPTYETNELNGQPVVRFPVGGGAYFSFPDMTDIRTVFWVVKEANTSMHFLLGHSSNYDFHRGDGALIWHSVWASANIKNGTTRLNGPTVNGTTTALPAGWNLISLGTTGNVMANRLTQDRTYGRTWEGDIAEVLIYNVELSPADELLVGSYLADKYGLTTSYPPPVPPAAPTGLVATPLHLGVRLDWTASASFGVTGYKVDRLTGSGGTIDATYDASGLTYTDTTVTTGGPYYYVVRAVNSYGVGPASAEVSASPSAVPVNQTITFALGLAVTKTSTNAPFADTATAFPSGLSVTYSSDTPAVATVDASTGVVTLTGVPGTAHILADQAGNADFNAATQVSQTLTVNQAIPVITWTPTPIVVGTLLSDTQLNASSGGVPGTFVYTPPSGTAMNVLGPQNLSVQFTPTDTVKYSTPALKTVEFLVVPVETTVIWNTVDGTWNTTVANWKGQSSGLTTIYTQGNNAIFNSSAGGTITIASGMEPASLTVSATSGTYTFGGGPIAGTGSLTKSGNGGLTLNASNTYTGGTVINAGQLTMNTYIHGALGTGTVTLNGGTLRLERITTANSLIVNGGTLFLSNGWGCNWNGPVTLNANLTVSGDGNSGGNTFGGIVSGVGGLTFTGPAALLPRLAVANTYTGPTSVTACTLKCDNKDALGSGALSLSTTGKLNLNYTGTKTVASLTLGGVAMTAAGTYGSVASGANFPSDTYFTPGSTGTVRVPPPRGTVISFF